MATAPTDRKSTRLNSSHLVISYAVFCLKKIVFSRRIGQHDVTSGAGARSTLSTPLVALADREPSRTLECVTVDSFKTRDLFFFTGQSLPQFPPFLPPAHLFG